MSKFKLNFSEDSGNLAEANKIVQEKIQSQRTKMLAEKLEKMQSVLNTALARKRQLNATLRNFEIALKETGGTEEMDVEQTKEFTKKWNANKTLVNTIGAMPILDDLID